MFHSLKQNVRLRILKQLFRHPQCFVGGVPAKHGLERVEMDRAGLLRVIASRAEALRDVQIFFDARPVTPTFHFQSQTVGFCDEYLFPAEAGRVTFQSPHVRAEWRGNFVCEFPGGTPFAPPHYAEFLDDARVLQRSQVYGAGLPRQTVDAELWKWVADCEGPILDFGSGIGCLVEAFRQQGKPAFGLELEGSAGFLGQLPSVREYLTFYDGSFPAPFADGAFKTVVCAEVLEHIPNYEAALEEMARLTSQTLVLTVPDMAAIPQLARHGVVPWHLLESTHLNFFNLKSLSALVEPYFPKVKLGKAGPFWINGTLVFTSVVAYCEKRSIER
jgi:hypothetical protein